MPRELAGQLALWSGVLSEHVIAVVADPHKYVIETGPGVYVDRVRCWYRWECSCGDSARGSMSSHPDMALGNGKRHAEGRL